MDDLEGNAGADQTAAQNAGQNAGQTTAFSRFYKAPMGRVVRHLVTRKLGLIMPEAQPPKVISGWRWGSAMPVPICVFSISVMAR